MTMRLDVKARVATKPHGLRGRCAMVLLQAANALSPTLMSVEVVTTVTEAFEERRYSIGRA